MRSTRIHIVLTITLIIVISIASAYKVVEDADNLIEQRIYKEDSYELDDSEYRMKRQLENFDENFPTASTQEQQEEPGFWDRIVKVALKLFNRFVEWLNSSD